MVTTLVAASGCDDGGGTGGTGGAGSTSSKAATTGTTTSTATTSTSGTTTASTGTGTGTPCTVANPTCGAGNYCKSADCTAGTCAPLGTEDDPNPEPVCGCDGSTYWNAKLADKLGANVAATGKCANGDVCGGKMGAQCDAGATCNYEVASEAECNIADLPGVCWVIPSTCPPVTGFGPNTRACGSLSCTDQCNLIKLMTAWYVDNTCPQ